MSASQIPVRAAAAEDGWPLLAPYPDPAAAGGRAGTRPGWRRRLCPTSFVLAAMTARDLVGRRGRPAQAGPPRDGAVGGPGRARRSASGGAGGRDRDVRADLARRAPPGPGPRPRPGRVLRGPARHRRDPADDVAQRRGGGADRRTCALDRAAATEDWPGWLLVPVTVVAMDAANWLAHYADHRFGPLWRFHALHHSQEELSVLTSFRAHPLMHTTGFMLATIPVMVLMPTRPIAPVLITIYICIGTLQHANLRWTPRAAGRVLVSPAYHRLHHAPDTQGVNLGVVLTVWDVLVGRDSPAAACRGPHRPARPAGSRRAGRRGRQACGSSPGSSSSHSRPSADRGRPGAAPA